MIPRDYITEWRQNAPWVDDAQVEQDLVICRALVEIFSSDVLHNALAFRGGTALYKLYLEPARYSEDIDLVQVNAEPAGSVIDALRATLDPWLGAPRRKQKESFVTLLYRFVSEDALPLRLKIEINTREHFSAEGLIEKPFAVRSRWFDGECTIASYRLTELLGTKLRALYQRKKGRDLFDLATALDHPKADPDRIIDSFKVYMEHGGHHVSRSLFEENLANKMEDARFTSDLSPLLVRGHEIDMDQMFERVIDTLICRI